MLKISEKRKLDLTDREVAESVQKVGGGTPCENSIRVWREKFEADPDWYPGKQAEDAEKPGRKKVITKAQEAAIAKSAMSLKRKGVEPTVAAVTAQCPAATLNPETDEPFSAKVILEVSPGQCLGKLYTLLRGAWVLTGSTGALWRTWVLGMCALSCRRVWERFALHTAPPQKVQL